MTAFGAKRTFATHGCRLVPFAAVLRCPSHFRFSPDSRR
jgi:hypothetical protein